VGFVDFCFQHGSAKTVAAPFLNSEGLSFALSISQIDERSSLMEILNLEQVIANTGVESADPKRS
jgi:hypothetical protein